MKTFKLMGGALFAVTLLLFFSTVAGATVLTPLAAGGTVTPLATTETGTLIAGTTVSAGYSLVSGANGTVTEAVYCVGGVISGKTCTGGTLDFVYQFTNASATDGIGELSVSTFTGFTTAVGYQTTALVPFTAPTGTNPNPQSAARTTGGETVDFNFAPVEEANPGMAESAALIVGTNATTVTSGFVSVIDGGSQTLLGFESPLAIPEPGFYGFLAIGLAMIFVAVKYRRKKQNA